MFYFKFWGLHTQNPAQCPWINSHLPTGNLSGTLKFSKWCTHNQKTHVAICLSVLLWSAWRCARAEVLNWSDLGPQGTLSHVGDIFGCRNWGQGDCYRYWVGTERPDMLLLLLQALQCPGQPHTKDCENPELELHDGGSSWFLEHERTRCHWWARDSLVSVRHVRGCSHRHGLSLQTPSPKQRTQGPHLLSSPRWATLHRRAPGSHSCTELLGAGPSCSAGCHHVP